jgi:hypothetical protein
MARIEVAALAGTVLGPPHVLVTGCLCTSPTWAPDGSGLAYMAPGAGEDAFQLWWVPMPLRSSSAVPRQVVDGLDLDATSRPAWRG